MLNGVRDQLVDDKAKRHGEISPDNARVGVDCQRPDMIGAARRRRDAPAKVGEILVKRDRPDIIRFMKVFVNGRYGPDACGSIVELSAAFLARLACMCRGSIRSAGCF